MTRVVSPYRQQAPESGAHVKLGAFDWTGALAMLSASAARFDCETVALTDETTDVGALLVLRYPTAEPRLMLWILEVSLAYLSSPDFDCDTVFVSPDSLVVGDLRRRFYGDLSVLVRHAEKYRNRRPILNSVQWWPVGSKRKLIAFYAQALEMARALPSGMLRWGADCEALRVLLAPLAPGTHRRAGLSVSMPEATIALQTIDDWTVARLEAGRAVGLPGPTTLVVDFKGRRKLWMGSYFRASGLEALCA